MSDADFQLYLEQSNKARIAAGLLGDDPDVCPLLAAEELLRKAQRLLVSTMEPITHLTADDVLCSRGGLANYSRLIELTLKLLGPFIGSKAA